MSAEEAQVDLLPRRMAAPVVITSVSQAFSAASNFAIVVALTRASGSAEVGRYILAFTVYTAALTMQRAMLTDALIARRPGSTAPVREEDNRTLTVAAAVSLTEAVVILMIGWGTGFKQLSLLSLFLVFLLMQDACRYVLFRNLRHGGAAILDGIWFVVSCTAFVILRRHPGHVVAVTVWGTGGSLACFVGLAFVRFRPAPLVDSLRWWREHLWPSTRWLALESVFFQSDQQVQAFGLTALAGPTLFGRYQQAGSLVNPAVFLTTGIALVAVTHFSRNERGQYGNALVVSAVCFGCVAAVTGVLLSISHFVIHLLYGNKTTISNAIILATGAIYACVVAATGVHGWLRSQRSERILPMARGIGLVVFAPIALVVADHHFVAGLWVLAAEAFVYMVIISVYGYRFSRTHEPIVTIHAGAGAGA